FNDRRSDFRSCCNDLAILADFGYEGRASNMGKVIGIDLGTTNSCVATMENSRPVVIANRGGNKTTPSFVAFTATGARLVGHSARGQAISNPEKTLSAFKRLIGRKWDSPEVRRSQEICSYRIVEGPHHDVRIAIDDKTFSVPEISAMVLVEMKRVAEEHL